MWPLTLAIGAIATHRFILLEVGFSEGDMIRPQCVVSVFTPARRRFASVSPSSNVLCWVFGCCVLKSWISKCLACSSPFSAVAFAIVWCRPIPSNRLLLRLFSWNDNSIHRRSGVTLPRGKTSASNLSAQTLLQMLHFTHLLSAPDVFWVHEDIPPPTLPPQHRASPIFYPDVLQDIWNAEWKRVAAHHVPSPSCDGLNRRMICLNFGECGYKTESQKDTMPFFPSQCLYELKCIGVDISCR